VIALPLLSKRYVRLQNVAALDAKYGWKFRTKHELAVELVTWFVSHAPLLVSERSIRLVADGAYATRKVLIPLIEQGVVVNRIPRCYRSSLTQNPSTKRNLQRILSSTSTRLSRDEYLHQG